MTVTSQPVLQPIEELKKQLEAIIEGIRAIDGLVPSVHHRGLSYPETRQKLGDQLQSLEDWLQPFLSPYAAQQPKSTEEPTPLYEFTGIIRAEEVHSEGKFQGKNITVYATDSTEAADKAERAFGKPPRAHAWFVYFNEMKEVHR